MRYAGNRTVQPVFLVNGVDRAVRMGAHVPIQVLPRPLVLTSIEELAASYLTIIERTQPFGPYRLLGTALGGLVAYEVASQLLGRDERVEFLGMIDCPRPGNLPHHPGLQTARAVTERYCPHPLPIPLYYFLSDARSGIENTRAWRALAGDSLRVIAASDSSFEDVLADAIERAPRQQFLQFTDREAYRPLITLQIGLAHDTPMIFVPCVAAGLTSCMGLVRSLRQQSTVHGLQPRGFNGTSVPHRTVQAAAAVYLRAIRQVQPSGPYRLAGHAFGGWVVFELACRLASEGEVVDPIVLIDTEAPTPPEAECSHRGRLEALLKLIGIVEEWGEGRMNLTRVELEALDYESQLLRFTQEMRAMGVLPRNCCVNDIRGLVRVFEVNLNTTYVPARRFPGSAILFQPEEERRALESSEAWCAHVGHLECVPVPGKHMTMLKMPHAQVIAEQMSRLWC